MKKGRPPKSGFGRSTNRLFWEDQQPKAGERDAPITTHMELYPKQAEFVAAALSGQYTYLLYGGAIRSGKSFVALTLAQILCRVFPGSRWAVVRKDLPTLRRNTLPTWKKVAVPGFAGPVNQGDWSVTMTNGSVLFFFAESIRDDPDLDRWKGLEVNGFVLEEANELDHRSWIKAIERAGSWILPGPQPPPLVILTSNPAWGWVKTTFYDPWRVGRLESPFYYQQATVHDNPAIPAAYLDSLKNLPENHYKRFVLGDWSVAAGLAFSQWDDTVHLLDHYDIPPFGVRVVAGMDWGIRAKSCIVLATVDSDDNVVCVKEWTWTDRDAYESGYEWALNLLAANLPLPDLLWCDPAMWNRLGKGGTTIGDEFQAGVAAAGPPVKCVPAPRGQGMRAQKFNLWNKKLAWGPKLADGTLPRSKQPAIRFVGKDCPYLVSSVPALPLDPTDSEDIDCFVAGTLVQQRDGQKPIEKIVAGEDVMTPVGYRRVIRSYVSGESRTVRVTLGDGRVLEGTPHHKVYVESVGMVELQHLYPGLTLTGKYSKLAVWENVSSIAESPIPAPLADSTTTPRGDSWRWATPPSTDVSGWTSTALFQRDSTFTTGTGIPTITDLRTWSFFKHHSTRYTTTASGTRVVNSVENWINGVEAQPDSAPFETTLARWLSERPSENLRALIVESLLRQDTPASDTARMGAPPRRGWSRRLDRARSAVQRFVGRKPATTQPALAVISVVGSSEKKPVYNLTVEQAHLFYANGCLVTNTASDDHGYDAVGAMLLGLRPAEKPHLTFQVPENVHPGFIPGTGLRRSNLRTPQIAYQEALIAATAQRQEVGGRYGLRHQEGLIA